MDMYTETLNVYTKTKVICLKSLINERIVF